MIKSPFLLVKQLEGDVLSLLSYIDIADLTMAQQQNVADIKNGLVDARLDTQDYELAETRDDQLRNAKEAKARLEYVRGLIVTNTLNVFGAVDVAHITAQIGQINDRLR